ncbi:MAG: PIN domain-containing protein, partial [Candidatus Binataceae bacterium]
NLDRSVAEYARQLIWQYPALKPKDSIHVATAIKEKLPVLDSFDDGLLSLDGAIGTPPLPIGKPHVPEQLDLLKKE